MNAVASSLAERPVGEIAAGMPGAIGVLRRHGVDFCCHGASPLAEAARERGASLSSVVADLAALAMPGREVPESTGALIDLIETRYHAAHRREMPELARMARRVVALHGARGDAPHGLAEVLEAMAGALDAHMRREEQVLFPVMRRGGHPMIGQTIATLRQEHEHQGGHLHTLEVLTYGGVAPVGACEIWRALYAGTRKLVDDLMEHIHLENNVLFPRFSM
jgi:regulator of cell morphogenesis and NO signaling